MKKLIPVLIFMAVICSFTASALDKVEILETAYDKVYPSYSSVVMVEKDGLLGVVDLEGRVVVEFGDYTGTPPDSKGNTVIFSDGDSYVYDKNGNKLGMYPDCYIVSVAEGIYVAESDVTLTSDMVTVFSVKYFTPDGKILYTVDNAISAMPFADGYAAIRTVSETVIIDKNGEIVFTDTAPLMPIAACADGKIPFCAYNEDNMESLYVVDVNARERICLTDFEIDSESSFKKVTRRVENLYSFYFPVNEDGIEVYSRNGIVYYVIENPNTLSLSICPYKNGVKGEAIYKITDFNPDSEYIFTLDATGVYYDAQGKLISSAYEGATGFANGKAVLLDSDFMLRFANKNFEFTSEPFSTPYDIVLFGDVFCTFDRENYYIIALRPDSVQPVAPTPQTHSSSRKGMHNFIKINTYTDGVFSDVKPENWFFKNVAPAYETGLMYGKENGFDPSGNMTVAQTITMAARLHSIYNTGSAEFKQGSVWYQVYVDYCVNAGIIKKGEFSNYNRNATRAEFVRILSKSIPKSEFEEKNSVSSIPDVPSSRGDYKAVLMFYKAGIVAGSNDDHDFFPDSEITRAETAAVITRIIDKNLRLSFQ